VNLKEEFKQLPVAGLRRVEDDLDCLGMAVVIAVGRVGYVTASVSDPRRDDTVLASNKILHAPKAPAGQYCAFLSHWTSSTWSR
jgi:hypothetical protein